jgi:DNA-binding FadR family transcriptional regulator
MDQRAELVRKYLLRSSAVEGDKLPTERALVDALGVSRSTVRNALARLEAEGWIVRKVGSGTYLAPRPESARTGLLQVNPKQIMEARFALEPNLASLAAMNCTRADLERLSECSARYQAADSYEAFELSDTGYHAAIAEATHNPVLIQAYRSFTAAHAAVEWGNLRQRFVDAERRAASAAEHDAVLHAIRDRDPETAAAAMQEHLRLIAAAYFPAPRNGS